MDIPTNSKYRSKQLKMEIKNEDSAQYNDICFQLDSIISPRKPVTKIQSKKYKIDYNKMFKTLKSGYLMKKTLNKEWVNRYFILTESRLMYFMNESKKQLKGCFNLISLIQYNVKIQSIYPQIQLFVEMQHQQQKHYKILIKLLIQDQVQYAAWKNTISIVLSYWYKLSSNVLDYFPKIPKNHLLDISKFGKNNNFWNKTIISTTQLLKYASHLDIILLRSKNPFFFFHRLLMRSYYDHVAILIKDQNEKVYVFQAIQSKGVCISNLQNLLTTFHEQYEQLSYRKLISKTGQKLDLEKLQKYINSLIGKKYELSLAKLLIDNQTQIDQFQDKQNLKISALSQQVKKGEKNQKTYFCSQLIADIYLKFNILSEGKSNKYWPKDFQENDLSFKDNFELSPLMIVEMKEPQSSQNSQA